MAPKKGKGKKAKKDDDWSADEKLPLSLNDKLAALGVQDDDSEDEAPAPAKPNKSAFAGLLAEDLEGADEDDDGGLMGAIQQAAHIDPAPKKKKSKKQPQPGSEDEEATPLPSQGPVEMTADDLIDAEFGEADKKKKKKKGGKEQAEPHNAAAEDDEDKRPLSKKEKEKLKKQRQKEKEKAAKDAKKPAAAAEKPAAEATPEPSPVVESAAPAPEEDGEQDVETAGASKNKKKKKKPAAKEEPPAKAKPAKVSKQVLAMREALAAKQAAEAAQREAEEVERKRIEEEERKEAEEKEKLEAIRLAKKQKQKEKEALAKKEGRWKSPAQKAAEARAEAQRQALLASGVVKVAGLEEGAEGDKPKKVVYGKKKAAPKRQGPRETVTIIAQSSEPAEAEQKADAPAAPLTPAGEAKDVKDSWDAESDKDVKEDWDAESEKEEVKEDWDAESEEEAPAKPAAKEAPKPEEKPATQQLVKETASVPAPPQRKAAPPKTSADKDSTSPKKSAEKDATSSEEEDSSEDDSSEEETDSDEDSSDEDSDDEHISAMRQQEAKRKAEAAERKRQRIEAAKAAQSKDDLRSPICCILGHVDTGKTKLLDKIRQTNVQEGEAGGITQQIGATFFPMDAIRAKTAVLGEHNLAEYKLPGLLIIDTPGHESFTNLRSRGSSLCNIAILVVDIVHGLEPQTLESLRLLREKKTPFIVALNKIDRCYGWKSTPNVGFREAIANQTSSTRSEYEDRLKKTILEFAEQGLNAAPYYENNDLGRTVSLVPTSAITGEGVPDMLMLVNKLTQERMSGNLMYLSETECTVLEVKVIEGLGTTIDVVLTNGHLREGDKIVVCGLNGAIVTQIRALLTPQPMKEMRIRGQYVHHKEVKASLGIKIVAPDLEKAIAGSRLLLVTEDDDEEELKKEVMSDLTSLLNSVDRTGKGVWVQASTLGSLEALLDFLKVSKIPVSGINIGPVHKKDIVRASVMLERAPEYAVCLCFDVPVDKDAERLAEELGMKMFKADIIYHLFDAFTAHNKAVLDAKQKDSAPSAVWPCRLKILACFAKRSPIVLGCDVLDGSVRIGTPLCVVKRDPETGKRDIVPLGRVASMEINHKPQTKVTKQNVGAGVAIKIDHAVYESGKMFGRHFDEKDEVVSLISRKSIDILKTLFREEVSKDEWALLVKLKQLLDVQ